MIFRFVSKKMYEDELSVMIRMSWASGSDDRSLSAIDELMEEYILFCEEKSIVK